MALCVMATRLAGGTLTSPETLERVEREVMSRVREHKLDVRWLGNYALLGPYDRELRRIRLEPLSSPENKEGPCDS